MKTPPPNGYTEREMFSLLGGSWHAPPIGILRMETTHGGAGRGDLVVTYADPDWMPGPDYCYSCNRDEPLTGHDYLVCGECFHVYRTRLHLLWNHAKIVFGLCPWWQKLPWKLSSTFIRPSRIFTCPKCTHDF